MLDGRVGGVNVVGEADDILEHPAEAECGYYHQNGHGIGNLTPIEHYESAADADKDDEVAVGKKPFDEMVNERQRLFGGLFADTPVGEIDVECQITAMQ